MVMEDNPSPQHIGREFVRQYYTLLNKEPLFVHRFYSNDSSFIHGGLNPRDMNVEPARGQEEIHHRIVSLNFRDCKTKILLVDACETLNKGVVIQVIGELSNNGMPMRRFMQTFVLATQAARKYYVRNDIFRYQDEVFSDEEASDAGREDEEERNTPEEQLTPNIYSMQPKLQPSVAVVEPTPPQPTVNGHTPVERVGEDYSRSPEPTPAPVFQRQPTPDIVPQKVATPVASPKTTPPQASPQEQQQFSPQESEMAPESIGSWAAESANQQMMPETQQEEAAPSNEPKTFANLFKGGGHHGIPPTAPPPFSPANQVAAQAPSEQPPTSEVSNLPPQPQRAPRGPRTSRGFRDKDGRSERGDRDSWERPSSRASNEEVDYRNMNGTSRLDERDKRGPPPQRTGGRDWNFQDSQQIFVGNIPSTITEADLKECFGTYAKVIGVRINTSSRSTANYGFVVFESAEVVQQVLKKRPITHKSHQFNVEEKTARGFQPRIDRPPMDRRDDRGGPRGGPGPRSGSGGPYGGRPRDGESRGPRRDDERGPPPRDDRGPRRDGDERGPRRDDRGGRMGGRGSDRGGFGGPRR